MEKSMQSLAGRNKTLEGYQLPSQHLSIPENQSPIPPQYPHHSGQAHSQTHLFEKPPVYHEMPANMPIELPADLDVIRTTPTNNMNSDKGQNDPMLSVEDKPQMPYPPVITTVYGDVAGGNPYADDDTLATPTPTQEGRNGVGGEGYIGSHSYHSGDQGIQASSRNSGHEFIHDALLQLRFVDDRGEGASGEHSHAIQSGFGTAL